MFDGCMAEGGEAGGGPGVGVGSGGGWSRRAWIKSNYESKCHSMTKTNTHCNNTASTTTAMTLATLTLAAEPHLPAQRINNSNNINSSCTNRLQFFMQLVDVVILN